MNRLPNISRYGMLFASLLLIIFAGADARSETADSIRFDYLDIYIDTADQPLAAYQFEAKAQADGVVIVGVEGGEHPAFADAPYYDPAAMMNDRIVVAAFSTAADLPAGRTRVARLHLRLTGDATTDHALLLHTAASAEGKRVAATISAGQGDLP